MGILWKWMDTKGLRVLLKENKIKKILRNNQRIFLIQNTFQNMNSALDLGNERGAMLSRSE